MDTNLPGRIFEVIPFVEDGPPVNPSITVTHRMPRLSQSHQEVGEWIPLFKPQSAHRCV